MLGFLHSCLFLHFLCLHTNILLNIILQILQACYIFIAVTLQAWKKAFLSLDQIKLFAVTVMLIFHVTVMLIFRVTVMLNFRVTVMLIFHVYVMLIFRVTNANFPCDCIAYVLSDGNALLLQLL